MSDGLQKSDVVIFNRCTEETPKSRYRRMVQGDEQQLRRDSSTTWTARCDDGVADEDLPYDMKADVIRVIRTRTSACGISTRWSTPTATTARRCA